MKRLTFLLTSLFLLVFPLHAYADESWLIENFNSNVAIQQSGVVRVVETISVDFRDQPKHGIYRDIPYLYESNGKQTYTDVSVSSVLQNNEPAKYTITQTSDGYKEIKIGDPVHTITGRNVYTIMYTVTGVLRSFGDHDELYWNATGNNWQVPIQKGEATVTLPGEGITQITCYEGVTGSQTSCQSNKASPQVAQFVTAGPLQEAEGLTIVVGYTKGLVPLLTARPPVPYWEALFMWPHILLPLLVIGIGISWLGIIWYKNGRDYWFAGQLFGTRDQKGKVKPIGAHETISVEFTPPEDLRPAEIGVLMDERADTLDVTATIIDLAARGYLTITEIPKKWLFGKVDYLLAKSKPKVRKTMPALLLYEQLLLDKLFYKRSQIRVSNLQMTFSADLKLVKQALYESVVAKGFFPFDPEKVREKYIALATLCAGAGVGSLLVGAHIGFVMLGDGGVGVFAVGILLFLMVRYMPRKTAYGRELYRRSTGYYLFVDKAEKYRQRYFEKQNMFNEVLPYAIVFGLTKKFAKQMEKMGIKPEQPDWYVGSRPFATGVFVGNITNFSNSISSAIASTPSNSGGFSGGSSGGGFGGGGGGSW